jgi:prephenate dehydrogenase
VSGNSEERISDGLDTLSLPSPLELMGFEFGRTTLVGVGLIGGSIGLRMKAMQPAGMVVGHDRAEVLDEAIERGAIDRGAGDLSEAIADADLVVLATPIEETVRLLPTVLRVARAEALVTDTAPAKAELSRVARETSGARAMYVGGHPLAGSNRQGISNADAALFDNAYWLLAPHAEIPHAQCESLAWWVRLLGAYPLTVEPELHDQLMAVTTHVPFVLALALSSWAAARSTGQPLLQRLCTGNFQSLTAMAGLPQAAWDGVLRMNQLEIEAALDGFRAVLDACIKEYQEGRLPEVWQQAHAFQRKLGRERPGDWDANCELVVTVADRPGAIARIAGLLAAHEIGIRDIHVIYIRERRGGTMKVVLESRVDARRAMEILTANGYSVRLRD